MNIYQYAPNPIGWIDPLGLAVWKNGGFNQWFNNASVQDIQNNMGSVKSALRNGGGKHEMFPVAMADKAKGLGFSAEEIKSMSVDTKKITFVNVTDKNGNPVPNGSHTNSRAGSNFHNKLSADLEGANTKEDAKKIIDKHHNNHMKVDDCD